MTDETDVATRENFEEIASYESCPWCGARFEHNCERQDPAERPGDVYLVVVTSGSYSNRRLYVLEWFAVRELAVERASKLAELDDHWNHVWSSQYDKELTYNEHDDFEKATLSAARTAMRDPHWRANTGGDVTASYQVHALRCGADTFEHLERTAGSIMKALKNL